mmetsp:Transcript_2707/g.9569  ORF Transcript_2707/g.9569 Transcript_2707/m.9569 type:complete len:261 (-) Transcript_2707:239-1021(-)
MPESSLLLSSSEHSVSLVPPAFSCRRSSTTAKSLSAVSSPTEGLALVEVAAAASARRMAALPCRMPCTSASQRASLEEENRLPTAMFLASEMLLVISESSRNAWRFAAMAAARSLAPARMVRSGKRNERIAEAMALMACSPSSYFLPAATATLTSRAKPCNRERAVAARAGKWCDSFTATGRPLTSNEWGGRGLLNASHLSSRPLRYTLASRTGSLQARVTKPVRRGASAVTSAELVTTVSATSRRRLLTTRGNASTRLL